MRIFDVNNKEIKDPNLERGYLRPDQIFITSHIGSAAVDEIWHYEYREYPNGGRDAIRVVDVPGRPAQESWDEYEDILRYVEYTPEELASMEEEKNRPSMEQRLEDMENALRVLLTGMEVSV